MAKKSLHRIHPQQTINRIRISPDTLTPQQREETLSRIQVPVTAVFTEDPHPEVFRQVILFLNKTLQINTKICYTISG